MRKIPFLDAQQEFIKRGYEPLFDEEFYRTCNNKTSLPYRCPHHPTRENKICLAHLKRGSGCPWCAGNAKITFFEAIQEFIKRGYEPLFSEEFYRTCNNGTPLPYRCPHHPKRNNKISLNDLKSGCGCMKCAGKAKATFPEAQQEFINRGYEPLFDEEFYKKCNNKTPLPYRCPHHPKRNNKISLNDLKGGHGCAACNESKGEKLVAKCCEKLSINFDTWVTFPECKDKGLLPFDLYLPDHKVLIEVDGDHHYPEFYEKNKHRKGKRFSQERRADVEKKDAIKTQFAKDYGYELIRFKHTIDEPLTDHEDYVLSILSHYTNRK